jgi:uracil-DNA glycosylase
MDVKIEPSWKEVLSDEFQKPYFEQLVQFVKSEYKSNIVYPPAKKIFAAFEHTPFEKVKVVIIGQDPYHGPNQANGLCFSVEQSQALPPSLVNIFAEISSDLGVEVTKNGDLSRWSVQGVLLLNATLTVRAHQAGSHQKKGWETFTDAAIAALAQRRENIVFMLWGAYAQKKTEIIKNQIKHLILRSVHPSPLSAHKGFLGCKHFSQANRYLESKNISPIDWR